MSTRPETAVPTRVAYAGVAGTLSAWLLIYLLQPSPAFGALLFLGACALPMWWLELRRFPLPARKGNLVRALAPGARNWRLQLRLLGMMGALFALLLTFTTLRQFSPAYISGFIGLMPVALPLALAWTLWMLLRTPRDRGLDSLESMGLALSHLRRRRFTPADRQALLGWMVKAIFIPIMVSSVFVFLDNAFHAETVQHGWWRLYNLAYESLFAIDTAFATIGYCSASRRIGAQIRSTDTTVVGWLSALVCYPPLNVLVLHQWLAYKDGFEWTDWLAGYPLLLLAWGGAILALTAVYVWATVAFGPRFSNLTHRGIITSGPYRYCKHPSYFSKNLTWWMISIPFISNAGTIAAISSCAALLAINGIYLLRARTEERHLMRDPVYREYSAWIARRGLLARCKRLLLANRLAERQ